MTPRGRPPIGPRLDVRLPDDLHDRLLAEAMARHIPVAELVRRILTEALGKATA